MAAPGLRGLAGWTRDLWLKAGWRRLVLAAGLGAATATGQAPLGLWFLALPALAGLTFLVARETAVRAAALIGWLAGAGYFAGAMFWIVEPFLVDAPRHGWMAPFALLAMAFGMALFWLLAAGVAAWLRGGAMGFAVALAAVELLRGYVLTGLPWALVGHVWIGTPVAQAAAFVGPVGLTLLTTLAAALPVALPRRGAGAGLAVLGLAAAWAGGAARLAQPEAPAANAPVVRLVQPNAEQHLKWRGDMVQLFLDRQLAQTAAPPEHEGGRKPDLVIWGETAVPWLLNRPGPVLEMIAAAAQGAPVALGIQRSEGLRYYNALAVIGPDARPLAVYDKFHLVPFGEYVPFGDVLGDLGVTAFAAREGYGYSKGPGARVLDLGALGKVQPLICYEAVFPQDLRAAPERPDWLLQITNDGWFGRVSGPYQHLAQARLRAVEQGLPLIRVANTGMSAVIDAKGRVLRSLPLGAVGIIDAPLPPPLPATPYARSGDLPAALLLLAALAGLALRRRLTPA